MALLCVRERVVESSSASTTASEESPLWERFCIFILCAEKFEAEDWGKHESLESSFA